MGDQQGEVVLKDIETFYDVVLPMISLDYSHVLTAAASNPTRATPVHKVITDQVTRLPRTIDLPVESLFSTLGRTAARCIPGLA